MNIKINDKVTRKIDYIIRHLRRYFVPKVFHHVFDHSNDKKSINIVYVINLERQPDRWKQIKNEAKRQYIKGGGTLKDYLCRVAAFDGKKYKYDSNLKESVVSKFNIKDQYYVDPDPQLLTAIRDRDIWIDMSQEEIAVTLSHISCWKKIVAENRSHALILEDDVFFEGSFANKLNLLWKELPTDSSDFPYFDLLHLSYREVDRGADKIDFSSHLMRPIKGLWWLSGYVLSYAGAKKLIDLLPVNGPVDLWMNLQFPKINVYASLPSIIFQRNDLNSDNNYSIMPILSQIGIQSDKTHLELQQRKGRNPVFVICQDDKLATMMETALSLLGYRCCFDKWGHLAENIELLMKARHPLLFDAYIGLKYLSFNYKSLASLYPAAVFIFLTDSDPKSTRSDIFDLRKINLYFGDESKKLLLINDNTLNDWDKLCRFLYCKVPPFNFPKNSAIYSKRTKDSYDSIDTGQEAIQLQHDVTPWIIPIERLSAFGVSNTFSKLVQQMGKFSKEFADDFMQFTEDRWRILNSSFPSNLAEFVLENFKLNKSGGFTLTLDKKISESRDYQSASIASRSHYLYGRFEIVMKPVRLDGIITAFFLHRNDPWQEIDFEILGKDTTKALVNVYFNPGTDGSGWNFGNRGTPTLINLGFDAAIEFHKYTIEWEPHEIRWLVDDKVIYVRTMWQPTPIPDQPMHCFTNLWPSRSEELVGIFADNVLPVYAQVKSISIDTWTYIKDDFLKDYISGVSYLRAFLFS